MFTRWGDYLMLCAVGAGTWVSFVALGWLLFPGKAKIIISWLGL